VKRWTWLGRGGGLRSVSHCQSKGKGRERGLAQRAFEEGEGEGGGAGRARRVGLMPPGARCGDPGERRLQSRMPEARSRDVRGLTPGPGWHGNYGPQWHWLLG
jgi:hypothetical protein